MAEVRCAIVGMGIGRPNGRALARHPRGKVVALCDLDQSRMDSFASELPEPVRCFTDYKQLCRDPEVDAIFVGTPNQWHVPIAVEAARHDKHVMVTKPLADSMAAARKVVDAAEAAGVVNMMSLSTRFSSQVKYLGAMARRGELGDIYYGRARSMRRSGIPDWSLGFVQAGGGAFRDMGVHVLDAAWWLMGMPQPLGALGVAGARFGPRGQGYTAFHQVPKAYSDAYASDDYAGGMIRFEGGAGLQVESFWAGHMAHEGVQIELFGSEAGATLNPLQLYRTVDGAPHDTTVSLPQGPEPWDHIADHFIACILDGAKCEAPLRHGMIVQEMLEAVLKSAETGREVRIKPADR
jgi:predicted dehydrogenase